MISIDELESYLRLAIAHARFMGIEQLSPGKFDYYRTFGNERFEVEKESKPMIGSLYDDFSELKKLSLESSRISCVDLDRLAELLHLLSDSISDPQQRGHATTGSTTGSDTISGIRQSG